MGINRPQYKRAGLTNWMLFTIAYLCGCGLSFSIITDAEKRRLTVINRAQALWHD
jgi:hypothetical protein